MAERSPAEWLDLLERRLHDRWAIWSVFDNYYEGDHRITAWLRNVQASFSGTTLGNLLTGITDNYMPLVVDSVAERMRVQGFRFGDETSDDDDAWSIWQANGLSGESNMLHTESIKLGEAYWLVQPNGDTPAITAEHPSQVIVASAPGNRRTRLAALKKWVEDDGSIRANVYLPDRVAKYRSERDRMQIEVPVQKAKWKPITTDPNPLGEVPVVPVPNNPSLLRGGKSDLAGGPTSLQDAITKSIVDLLIGCEYVGFPQRAVLGVEPPRDPSTGRVISSAKLLREKILYFNSKDAELGEFSQANLKGLRETADGFIGDLAAQTRIPIYYFRPAAISNISAEALIGLDAGLVSKASNKRAPFGEAHTDAIRLAFKSIDPSDPRARATSAETIWADTESRSMAQVADAAVKKKDIGVPFPQLAEDLGYSPQQVDRMETARAADALLVEPPAE